MSFKCPANYIEGKNKSLYKKLVDSYTINIDEPGVDSDDINEINKYINNSDNLPSFLKSGVLPSSIDPKTTTYTPKDLKAILKGLTRKITSCSTAYKSTEFFTIISKLKRYFSGNNVTNNLIKVLYILSYVIIAYLGYNYITNKMFGGDNRIIPSEFGKFGKFGKSIYYIFIVFIPITMTALMISNKVNVSFNVSRVLILFSLALIVFIALIKTVASKNPWLFAILMLVTFILSGITGWAMYNKSGDSVREVNEDNQEREKSDAFQISLFSIGMIAIIMIIGIQFIGSNNTTNWTSATLMFIGLIVLLSAGTAHPNKYKNKRALFYFVGIFIPFILIAGIKFYIYINARVVKGIAAAVAVYVGLKVAILSGLLTLGTYEALKAGSEIARVKKDSTSVSESPYYHVTKPINALLYIYYIILGLIIFTIFIAFISQVGVLYSLNKIPGLEREITQRMITQAKKAELQGELNNIKNGKTWGFNGIDLSYILAVVIVMSLILSYNGTLAIWLPFVLIPVGLLERGVASIIINTIRGNTTKEIGNWQPVGSYLIEVLIKIFTYTPLSDQDANQSKESTPHASFLDVISELNSTMFYGKKKGE